MQSRLRALLAVGWTILALWIGSKVNTAFDSIWHWLFAFAFGSTALTAIALASKRVWSPWFVSLMSIAMMWLSIGVGFGSSLTHGLLVFLLGVVSLGFVWRKPSRDELHPSLGVWRELQKVFVSLGLVGFAILTLAYAVFEARNIRMALLKMRLETNCHDPKLDIEACGQLGIRKLDFASDEAEMVAGRDLLDTMCANGNEVACRNAAYARMTWQRYSITFRDIPADLWRRCQADGGTACVAIALQDDRPNGFVDVVKTKCGAGDADACVAWTEVETIDRVTAHTKACEVGVSGACSFGGVDATVVAQACQKSGDPWTCFVATGDQKYCAKGVFAACNPEEHPRETWTTSSWSVALWGIPPDEPSEGSPWNALVEGRSAVAEDAALWRPTPLPLEQIANTFGAACDAGIAFGCIEGALAAVNVELQYLTPERVQPAHDMLAKGCEHGDQLSCWLRLSVTQVAEDEAFGVARDACYAAPRGLRKSDVGACDTYVALWMAKLKITPWLMDTTLASPRSLELCASQKDRRLCQVIAEQLNYADYFAQPNMLPRHVTAWNASAVACSKHDMRGCRTLVTIAKMWPFEPAQTPEELVLSVCAKVPEMCETTKDALKSN
ncbi:MAG: hypothetical protein R3E66_06580 [bacterium]